MKSENMSYHSSTKNFGKFQSKLRPADDTTFLFGLHLLAEKWTSADMVTLKEPVLLLGGENKVALSNKHIISPPSLSLDKKIAIGLNKQILLLFLTVVLTK